MNEPPPLNVSPSLMVSSAPAFTLGATLAADQLNVSATNACSPSLASTVTEPEPSLLVGRFHDQVPLPLSITVPSPLDFVIVNVVFPSPSENAPEVLRVSPSLPLASSAEVATAGAYELESQALPSPSPSASA